MEYLIKASLFVHIICGFTALLAGSIVLVLTKGNYWHRLIGGTFFKSMIGVCISAILLSVLKDNRFLLLIGIFSFYQNYFGYRAIKNKSLRSSWADLLVQVLGAANAFFMLSSGNMVLMVFGVINSILVLGGIITFIKISKGIALAPKKWLSQHIGMMMGAFIATFTAFLVVSVNNIQPAWLVWLAPTFVLTPLMIFFFRKYTPKPKTLVP